MPRIRSIHPGIWTDDNFAMLSMGGRVLLFGIWTEADDHGVFEWKPVQLKMRIFPADNVDLAVLLDDLTTFNEIRMFTHEGREYGVVRNFCKYQRPKKPNYRFVLPDELRTYAGLKPDSSEPVPNQFPTGGENSSLMEEEGGRRKEKEESKTAATASPKAKPFFESGCIKLSEVDFRKWEQAFSNLDLRAELIGLTHWASEQPKWFFAVSGALAKRNRDVGVRVKTGTIKPSKDSFLDPNAGIL